MESTSIVGNSIKGTVTCVEDVSLGEDKVQKFRYTDAMDQWVGGGQERALSRVGRSSTRVFGIFHMH